MMDMVEFKTVRKKLKLTQQQLAAKLDVSERTIRRYEDGTNQIIPRVVQYALHWLTHVRLQEIQRRGSLGDRRVF